MNKLYIMIGAIVLLGNSMANAGTTYHNYKGVEYQKRVNTNTTSFYSKNGNVKLMSNGSQITFEERINLTHSNAINRNKEGKLFNNKMTYICGYLDCTYIEPVIPSYITKEKDGIDKVVNDIENFIKDHGNLYLQYEFQTETSSTFIQYKSEYGDEYVGIKFVKEVELNCILFKLCINK